MNRLAIPLTALLAVVTLIGMPLVASASDAGAPIADAPRPIGGTVFSGYMNETNTHMRLNVSVGNDAANIGGVVRTYVSVSGGGPSDVEIGTAHTILAGQIGTKFDVPDITIASILAAVATSSLVEGRTYTFKKRVFEADNDPLSLVALGTLTVALTGNHPAPSIDDVYVGLTTTDAEDHTFSTATTSFEFVISNDSDLNTLTCKIDSLFTDDCFSYALSGATQTYSYASSTLSLANGTHTLVVVATDVFSQAATSTTSFCITSCTVDAEESSAPLGNGPPELIGVVQTQAPSISPPSPPPVAPVPEQISVVPPPVAVQVSTTTLVSQVEVFAEVQQLPTEPVPPPVAEPIAPPVVLAQNTASAPVETAPIVPIAQEVLQETEESSQAWVWVLMVVVVGGGVIAWRSWSERIAK